MKVAHLDAFSGIAGDMVVGALLDTGLSLADLESELRRIRVEGFRVRLESRERSGIRASKFVVEIPEEKHHSTGHGHSGHGEHHEHRSFRDIRALIRDSDLQPKVAELALQIFGRLAEAEGTVHGVDPEDVTFHEVGAIDAIVDIVGTSWGIATLGIEQLTVSPLPLGQGLTRSQHGTIPVPGPATLELLRGFPVRAGDGDCELVTPTGAAIVAALARPGAPPQMTVERIGYGAGDRDLADRPNLLRVVIGTASGTVGSDSLFLLEANVDDLNPEFYEHVMERLFAAGARDVFLTSTHMKKNRPGVLVSVLADPARRDALATILFAETSTLGVRVIPCERLRVEREIREVDTRFGRVRVKIGFDPDGTRNVAPEYEDCRRIALATGTALKVVYQEAIRAALE